ncbi:hypothetical protein BTA51_12595 [Hahella sp. CCB-MM4]|uniref:hypothetical protein n=1 Tax=Hahella sp. (strain CCB-MM4) TaxID=1926491 RepID=UPI000B9B41A1|nr:hypothetical protein [Hahella sp. CCB-MM4]OZG72812.1 hypothetical protein BTA51_12595 [Hahella sp. CCB-MM4]
MNKGEWIWVAIRIFGIFLLVLGIKAIPDAVSGIYGYIQISAAIGDNAELAQVVAATQKAALTGSVKAITSILVYLPFSYYFLRHGKWLHRLASSETA